MFVTASLYLFYLGILFRRLKDYTPKRYTFWVIKVRIFSIWLEYQAWFHEA